MTTLPYWMAFDAAGASHGVLPGTKLFLRLASKTKPIVTSLAAINKTSSAAETRRIRYCPKCLEQDHSTYGEPYWHRIHQLPSVFFCPDHHCALSSTCPQCERSAVLIGWTLAAPPPLRCICGHDLRKPTQQEEASSVYRDLARFSAAALNHHPVQWNQILVRHYLRAELSSRLDSGRGTLRRAISKAFAVERSTDQMLYVRVPGQSPPSTPGG